MTTAKTKGSGFLKVTGILMIIGGGISIILGIIAALGVAALAYISDGEISSAMLYASAALMIVSAVNCRNYRRKKLQETGKGRNLHGVGHHCSGALRCRYHTEFCWRRFFQRILTDARSCFASSLHHRRCIQQERLHCIIIHTLGKGLFRQAFSRNKLNYNKEETRWISVEFGK